MMKKLQKVARFILHHNTLTAITFLLFGIGCYFVIVSNDNNKLGTISNMATALAIIVAMIQLLASNRQHRETARRAAAEKAIEIAKFCQESLLHDISYVTTVLGLIGQRKYEQSDKLNSRTLRFCKEELVNLFGEFEIDAYEKMQTEINGEILQHAALVAARRVDSPFESEKPVEKEISLINDFSNKRSNVLNTLEWLAMTLNTGVAEEKVLYQSLHQMILPYIRLEYPTIATLNSEKCACDQYYTNLILLYNKWQKRNIEKSHADKANQDRANKARKRFDAKQNKKRDKTVSFSPNIFN